MTTSRLIDALDARILIALDDEPDASILRVASVLGISRNTVHARLQRLQRDAVLEGFSRRVPTAALGRPLKAFVSLAISQRDGVGAASQLEQIPEIVEVHITTGDADLLAIVVARDTEDLHRITNRILDTPGIVRSSTSISLSAAMPYRTRALIELIAAEPSAPGNAS